MPETDLVCRLLLEKKKLLASRGGCNTVPGRRTVRGRARQATGDGALQRANLAPLQRPRCALAARRCFARSTSDLFFTACAPPRTYTLSLHDALPIFSGLFEYL